MKADVTERQNAAEEVVALLAKRSMSYSDAQDALKRAEELLVDACCLREE